MATAPLPLPQAGQCQPRPPPPPPTTYLQQPGLEASHHLMAPSPPPPRCTLEWVPTWPTCSKAASSRAANSGAAARAKPTPPGCLSKISKRSGLYLGRRVEGAWGRRVEGSGVRVQGSWYLGGRRGGMGQVGSWARAAAPGLCVTLCYIHHASHTNILNMRYVIYSYVYHTLLLIY